MPFWRACFGAAKPAPWGICLAGGLLLEIDREEKKGDPKALMSTQPNRNLATFLLVLGAVIFGMVLAGGLQLTAPSIADQETSRLSATRVASEHANNLPSFADLAEAVDPAVVSIQAATIGKGQQQQQGGGGTDPFEFFFGPRQRPRSPNEQDNREQPEFRSDSGGSGFVISSDGLIVTNNHVIEGSTSVKVHLGDRDYPAEVKGVDKSTDIALLKIDAGRPLTFLDSATVTGCGWATG